MTNNDEVVWAKNLGQHLFKSVEMIIGDEVYQRIIICVACKCNVDCTIGISDGEWKEMKDKRYICHTCQYDRKYNIPPDITPDTFDLNNYFP